jgi:excisionase family DNA binding protein
MADADDPSFESVREFARRTSISRSLIYKLIQAGELQTYKVGRRTLVDVAASVAWLRSRPKIGNRKGTTCSDEVSPLHEHCMSLTQDREEIIIAIPKASRGAFNVVEYLDDFLIFFNGSVVRRCKVSR